MEQSARLSVALAVRGDGLAVSVPVKGIEWVNGCEVEYVSVEESK